MNNNRADFSVLKENRLAAFVWAKAEGGVLRRSSNTDVTLAPLAFAEIQLMDRGLEATWVEWVKTCTDLDGFLFKLKLEGYEIRSGSYQPSALQHRY